MNDKTLNKIFDDLIDEAAVIAAEKFGSDMPDPEIVEFSRGHEDVMQKIFMKERKRLFFKKVSRYLKRAAIFLIAIVVVSSATVFSVEAWRIKVLNFIIEMSQTGNAVAGRGSTNGLFDAPVTVVGTVNFDYN